MVNMVNENDFDANLIWLTSATVSFCLALTVITCVCGCRKRVPKNELLGLAGLVKITNPDENVNYGSGASPNVELNTVSVSSNELSTESQDSNKRGHNAVATATRSLPDLPVDSGETAEKLWGPAENNVDTNSDLYATVEDAGRKKRTLTSGLTVDSQHSYTPSQTDESLSPYARLKGEHPYDQLQQNEHPYAQVGPNGTNPGPSSSNPESTVNSTPSSRPQEREETSKSPSLNEVPDEIQAASAIAGSVPANHDLPYMTPPIPAQQQQHFSGDSVDSSKGYTSISVREPLSRILATRRNGGNGGIVMDSHYATVSDDSDEMYAAIEERQSSHVDQSGGGEYTSGSETYAQIAQPHSSSSHNASNHPPNLSLVLHHQDSVSTCSSDSPRRDRRVANSPLPQVPALDEMYAKVIKKGRSPTSPEPPGENSSVGRRTSQVVDDEPSSLPGYETVNSSDPNYEELQPSLCGEPDYASLSRRYPEGFIEMNYEPTYETARYPHSTYEPGSLIDPNYESVGSSNEPPYERVNSIPPEPPDYELVCSRGGQMTSVSSLYAKVHKPEKKST